MRYLLMILLFLVGGCVDTVDENPPIFTAKELKYYQEYSYEVGYVAGWSDNGSYQHAFSFRPKCNKEALGMVWTLKYGHEFGRPSVHKKGMYHCVKVPRDLAWHNPKDYFYDWKWLSEATD